MTCRKPNGVPLFAAQSALAALVPVRKLAVIVYSAPTRSMAFGISRERDVRRPEPPIAWGGVALVFLTPALGGLLYGYDIGATSVVILLLLFQSESQQSHSTLNSYYDNDLYAVSWWHDQILGFQTSAWQQGLVVAAVSLGAMAGSHFSFCYSERMGRRMELRIAAILYIVGTLSNVLSGTSLRYCSTMGLAALIAGRFVFGVGVGFVMRTYNEASRLALYANSNKSIRSRTS
jgi:MFS family permease